MPPFDVVMNARPPGAVPFAVPSVGPNPVIDPPRSWSLHVTLCSTLSPQVDPMAAVLTVMLPTA